MSEDEFDLQVEDNDEKVNKYFSEINMIMDIMGQIDNDLIYNVITSESKIEDFDLTDEEIEFLIESIGFNVENQDYIVDIAKKISDNT
jgi:predicted nuclease of restriction endonuclease-like RecB superfamily